MGSPTFRNDDTPPEERSFEDQRSGRAPSREAFARSVDGPSASLAFALHEPTAREVASAYLHGAVRVGPRTDARPGVASTPDALAAGHAGQQTGEFEPSENGLARIGERLQHAREAGDLPRDADPHLLARYLMTLSDGIGVEAGGGTGADELHGVVDLALQAWPSR